MRISEQGLDFIKSFEGLRLQSYWDKDGKVWTIGWGHTRGVKQGMVITKAQAEQFLADDLAPIERHLTADLGEDGVLQCQFDALCSWILISATVSASTTPARSAASSRPETTKGRRTSFHVGATPAAKSCPGSSPAAPPSGRCSFRAGRPISRHCFWAR